MSLWFSRSTAVSAKESSTVAGKRSGWRVSPWERKAVERTSPCEVRVGRPVEGPTRCTSKITAGTSAK